MIYYIKLSYYYYYYYYMRSAVQSWERVILIISMPMSGHDKIINI